ncbi:MAG: hypothetical protein RL365_313 [Bacteroidota bacterium]|jgi:hypothetical protein
MIKRFVLSGLALVLFLVTVGVPIFQHSCKETNSHDTTWFSYAESHCEDEPKSACCSIDQTDCCSVNSTIIALKVDQENSTFLPKLSVPLDYLTLPVYTLSSEFLYAIREPIVNLTFPPPPPISGIDLLKVIQRFRL